MFIPIKVLWMSNYRTNCLFQKVRKP